MALHDLEKLRQEEHHAIERGVEGETGRAPGREAAQGEQAHRHHRRSDTLLEADERDGKQHADRQDRDDLGTGPADAGRAHQPEDEGERCAARQHEALEVDRRVGAAALRDPAADERERNEADGEVEPEDPAPVEARGDRAARDRPGDQRKPGDAGENAERLAALLARIGGAQQRHRERHDQRGSRTLCGARRNQRGCAAGKRAGEGRRHEQEQPRGEHAPPPEPVAERGAGQEQHREGQIVGVDDPFQRFDRCAEIDADRPERGRDHERVERDHERGGRSQNQNPLFRSAFACLAHAIVQPSCWPVPLRPGSMR